MDARPALRVLHVGKFYPPSSGGIEKVVQVLCEAERAVVDSHVLVANDRPATVREVVNGVPVTRVASWTKVGAVALCPTFPYWMRRMSSDSDVIVIHEPNPVAIVAHAIVRPTSRLVFWMHAEVVRPRWRYKAFYRPFLRRVLRFADRIVVASPPVAQHAVELQDFREKCVVVPYGIDPDEHALADENRARVEQIRRERPEPLVLFVGRMVPYKGVDVLLRSLVNVNARAILVGEGPKRSAWQQLALDLGLGDRVRFAGQTSPADLAALYHACDVLVLPSVTKAEAFGMVQLEAMACRKPVVSTSLQSGVPWVNQDGVTGSVVLPGDAAALADAMTTLIEDPMLRSRMGDAGRARVLAEFSIRRMVKQTTALYRSVMGEPIHEGGRAVPTTATA